jgi:serine/threonine-protein kinase
MSDELVGRTLADYLATHERLPLGEGLTLLNALLETVGEAHRSDAADGALHPGRVLVTAADRIRLVPADEAAASPDADACRSPQQKAGETADVRADVYALGVIGYRMVLGTLPYSAGDAPVDPRTVLPNLNDRVGRALVIAVQKNLTERFADALTFRAALRGDSDVALETPTLRWAVAEGIPVGDTGAAEEFAGEESGDEDTAGEE